MEKIIHECKEHEELWDAVSIDSLGFWWYTNPTIEKWELRDSKIVWVMVNGEYENEINYCPFCGEKLK